MKACKSQSDELKKRVLELLANFADTFVRKPPLPTATLYLTPPTQSPMQLAMLVAEIVAEGTIGDTTIKFMTHGGGAMHRRNSLGSILSTSHPPRPPSSVSTSPRSKPTSLDICIKHKFHNPQTRAISGRDSLDHVKVKTNDQYDMRILSDNPREVRVCKSRGTSPITASSITNSSLRSSCSSQFSNERMVLQDVKLGRDAKMMLQKIRESRKVRENGRPSDPGLISSSSWLLPYSSPYLDRRRTDGKEPNITNYNINDDQNENSSPYLFNKRSNPLPPAPPPPQNLEMSLFDQDEDHRNKREALAKVKRVPVRSANASPVFV